ncbi:hypothetical protein [Micromonospora sp. NPDC049679]|uniref:hypothetical protein n=1 Tax=Micromonospora sp. NPDC049679 TaxID=3155920 RepID=UPI0033C7E6E6
MPTSQSPDQTEPSAAFPPLGLPVPASRVSTDNSTAHEATNEFPVIVRDDPRPSEPADAPDGAADSETASDGAVEPIAAEASATTVANTTVANTEPGVDPDAHPETVVEPDSAPEPESGPEPAVEAEPAPVDAPQGDQEEAVHATPGRTDPDADGADGADGPRSAGDLDDEDDAGEDDGGGVTAHGDAGDLFDSAEELDEEDQPDEEFDDEEPESDVESEDVQETAHDDALSATGAAAGAAVGAMPATGLRPGDVAESPIAVWSEERAQSYRDQWHDVKAIFVDAPEEAVAQAQALVADAVHALAETLLAEQMNLDPRRQSLSPDTETLRMAMRRYRDFLDRVLAL